MLNNIINTYEKKIIHLNEEKEKKKIKLFNEKKTINEKIKKHKKEKIKKN